MTVNGRHTLLNLAKNPTGFNQNLKIVTGAAGPKAVAVLHQRPRSRWTRHLLAVGRRLRRAGGRTRISKSSQAVFAETTCSCGSNMLASRRSWWKAQQTWSGALRATRWSAGCSSSRTTRRFRRSNPSWTPWRMRLQTKRRQLFRTKRAKRPTPMRALAQARFLVRRTLPLASARRNSSADSSRGQDEHASADGVLRIAHLFPDLLNLYGDLGNVRVLQRRCAWRGIPVEVVDVRHGEDIDLNTVDIVFLGGRSDREQRLASAQLLRMRDDLRAFVESDGVLLAICGGYQIWVGMAARRRDRGRPGHSGHRHATGRDASPDREHRAESPLATRPVGRLRKPCRPHVPGRRRAAVRVGHFEDRRRNNDDDKADGALYRNVIARTCMGRCWARTRRLPTG